MDEKVLGKKIETLRIRILEECRRQDFTVRDFEELVTILRVDLSVRQSKVFDELF